LSTKVFYIVYRTIFESCCHLHKQFDFDSHLKALQSPTLACTVKKTEVVWWSCLKDGWRQRAETGSTVVTGHTKVESWKTKEKLERHYMARSERHL